MSLPWQKLLGKPSKRVDETKRSHQAEVAALIEQAMGAARLRGDYREAIRLFTQAAQLDPANGEIYHNRGMAFARIHNFHEAVADFTRAINCSPHPSSFEQRAAAYSQMGDCPSARRDWEQALRIDPQRPICLVNLGWQCFQERQFRQAVDYYSRAISLEPTMAAAYANRARAYHEMGDETRAFVDYQRYRELVESGRDTSNNETLD